MSKISGSKYEIPDNVISRFDRDKQGRVYFTPEAILERAKISANNGFLVDPVTGQGFWSIGNWRDPVTTIPRKDS